MKYTDEQILSVLRTSIERFVRDADREGVGANYRRPDGRFNPDVLQTEMLFLERAKHHTLTAEQGAVADYFLTLGDDEKARLMREALSVY